MKFFQYLLWGFFFISCGCTDHESLSDLDNEGSQRLKTGVFLDSKVSGLIYETDSRLGKTDVSGEFLYLEGENISFYLGGMFLGSGKAAAQMSPASIASTDQATFTTREVKNIASLLQSLDYDRNPDNGITIRSQIADAVGNKNIDFSKMKIQIIGEVLAEIIQKTGVNLKPVYPELAAVHLNQTFGKVYVPENYTLAYFLPTIESWHEFSYDAVHWIHHTDDNDRLLTSSLYDKRPYRLVMQYKYVAYTADGLPVEIQQKFFTGDRISEEKVFQLTYTTNNHLESISTLEADGTLLTKIVIQNTDGRYRLDEVLHYSNEGQFMYREKIKYDKFGTKTEKLFYSSPDGTSKDENQNLLGTTTYSYNKDGEYRVVTHYLQNDVLTDVYRYRDDKTLKRSLHYRYSNSKWKRVVEYDHWENIISVTTISGDQESQSQSYSEVGLR